MMEIFSGKHSDIEDWDTGKGSSYMSFSVETWGGNKQKNNPRTDRRGNREKR